MVKEILILRLYLLQHLCFSCAFPTEEMSKIPLAERKECLARKKVERQQKNSLNNCSSGLMTREGKRNVEGNAPDVDCLPKIQKQCEGAP